MRRVPLWRRWALVTRDGYGSAEVMTVHFTQGAARRALRRAQGWSRAFGAPQPHWQLEPTDWASPSIQAHRILVELDTGGPFSAGELSRRTALSVRRVEHVLRTLSARHLALHSALLLGGETPRTAVHRGVWRITTPEERARADSR